MGFFLIPLSSCYETMGITDDTTVNRDSGHPATIGTEIDSNNNVGSDIIEDTHTNANTDADTDMSTDSHEGEVVFVDEFDDQTAFEQVPYPFGDPHQCIFRNAVEFSMDDNGITVTSYCYDEAALIATPYLPEAHYLIKVTWSTGVDAGSYNECGYSTFPDYMDVPCDTPLRVIVINDELAADTHGRLNNHSETTVVEWWDDITMISLGVASSRYEEPYTTTYSRVEIIAYE